jgi:hypothetical protein
VTGRGERMVEGVTMISRGVEISIAGGVEEMVRALTTVTESLLYRPFTPTTLTLVTHTMSHTVL